jgi:GPH family glycoside/pentoside/hexuronide:cation symporter
MKKLSVPTKFAYGIGQMGEQIKTTGFSFYVFFYFQQVLGLSGSLAGTAVLIALVFDAVTDPVVGSLSDNWKSRLGRRHPFMYAAALPLAVTWYMLFFPPEGLGQLGLFLWLTTFSILVRAAMTLYHVPHLALGAELTSDYTERTSIVGYRTVFGMAGGLGISFLGLRLFFPESGEYENALLNPAGYPEVARFGAIFMFITIWYSAWGTRKEIPNLPKAPEHPEPFSPRRVIGEIREAWDNISFRSLFIGFSLFAISMGVTGTLQTHNNVFFWNFSAQQYSLFIFPLATGFMLGVAIVGRLHGRYDKKPTLIVATILTGLITNLGYLAKIMGWMPDTGDPALFPVVMAFVFVVATLAAFGFISAGSMMADVAQDLEMSSGKSQQGMLFAATSFSGKLASGLGHFIAGVGLDVIAFPIQAEPSTVGPELIRRLGYLNMLAGSISFLGIYAYTYYSITHAKYDAMLRGADTPPAEDGGSTRTG